MTAYEHKVLVVAPNWIGDAVMSLPLLGYLSAAGVRVTVLANAYTSRIYAGQDVVDELIVMGKDGATRGVWKRARTLRHLNMDAALLLPPSFSSALTVALSGVPRRVGYQSDARAILLSGRVAADGLREEHLSENYIRLGARVLRMLKIDPPRSYDRPGVVVGAADRAAVARTLEETGAAREYAVVVPGAVYGDTKKWPAGKYRELVEGLTREIDVVLTGTDADRSVCEEIATDTPRATILAGRTSLNEFIALLAGASVCIANDSGAPHIAASLGVPTVVVFGSTSPTWTRPLGERVETIREPVHCSPCFRSQCPTQLECFAGVAVDRVLAAATAVFTRVDEVI